MQYGIALTLAFTGDGARVQSLIGDLEKRFPEGTLVQSNYLPTLRAKLAVTQGKPSDAIDTLRAGSANEFGQSTFSLCGWTALYPVFVRGEAYVVAHQGNEAAAEFQKILEHRGMVLFEPIGARAHLGLARAYALQGDRAKARAAYNDFFALWKDADAGIPILIAAKSEYAKLQ